MPHHPDCHVPGGHCWYDAPTDEWVALSYVRLIGRFKTLKEAVKAIKEEAAKYTPAE